MMEAVYTAGIYIILKLQLYLQSVSDLVILFSRIGDPSFAFTFFFPIGYCIHPSIGRRVLWMAVISEWLNTVFKWILHGERPYWWVHESNLYHDTMPPHMRQFNITCEVGPGSPSGHVMVSAAVMFVFLSDLIFYQDIKGKLTQLWMWMLYSFVIVGICVSRLYIAAHFPHQVVAGFFVGVLLARRMNLVPTSSLELKHYILATVGLGLATIVIYYSILLLNFDPLWSVDMAVRWCNFKEWIHLDTSTFYCIVRDLASLLALGAASRLVKRWKDQAHQSLEMTLVLMILTLTISFVGNYLKVTSDYMPLFYTLSFFKHFSIVFIIVYLVSLLNTMA